MNAQKVAVCIVLILCITATLVLPLMHYLAIGWRARRKDIMDGLSAEARRVYFAMFSQSEPLPNPDQAAQQFEKLYSSWYGRRFYIFPGVLLLLVGTVEATLVVFTALSWRGYIANPLFGLPPQAVAAIAGAYLWVVNDHIWRTRRLDFSPADVQWGVLRLVISVPMGYAFGGVAADNLGTFAAFAVGAFPLTALTSILRRLAAKTLGTDATPYEESDNAINLQGINKAILERFSNEDVATVTQIAYCDPVRLTMRSNLTFNFITDCMNQALAWVYLERDLDEIRPLGMRGACEIKDLMDDFDNAPSDPSKADASHALAVAALAQIAAAIKQTPETLQLVFRQIAEDPYTVFLKEIWTLPEGFTEGAAAVSPAPISIKSTPIPREADDALPASQALPTAV